MAEADRQADEEEPRKRRADLRNGDEEVVPGKNSLRGHQVPPRSMNQGLVARFARQARSEGLL
jgi:hypothetical protein